MCPISRVQSLRSWFCTLGFVAPSVITQPLNAGENEMYSVGLRLA